MIPALTAEALAYYADYRPLRLAMELAHMSDDDGRSDPKYNLDWAAWHERAGIVNRDWLIVEAQKRIKEAQ